MRLNSILVLFAAAALLHSAAGPVPLPNAHAHNDYEHRHPLKDALAQGFGSVEADIHLRDGKLLVGHDADDLRPERTLEALYLQPLQNLADKNGGRIYPGGPGIILLIDIKTEAATTYEALKPLLARHSSMLTRFVSGETHTNAVTVILSGNRPRELLMHENDRFASFDGRLSDLGKNLTVSFMPLVSDNFVQRFPSAKSGKLSDSDLKAFQDSIAKAHAEHRKIRFWSTADDPKTWGFLKEAGVDLINTDKLLGLADFLKQTK